MERLFALAPAAWNDARGILARRWWLVVVAAMFAALLPAKPQPGSGDLLAILGLTIVALAVLAVYSFYVYGDTMRLGDPAYTVTPGRFWRIVLISLGYGGIVLVLYIPALLAQRAGSPELAQFLAVVANVAVTTRFAFVCFAAQNPEGAFFYSWRVTSGAALLPSLVLAAVWVLAGWLSGHAGALVPAPVWHGVVVGVASAVTYASLAFYNTWLFRWMHVAESMQPPVQPIVQAAVEDTALPYENQSFL